MQMKSACGRRLQRYDDRPAKDCETESVNPFTAPAGLINVRAETCTHTRLQIAYFDGRVTNLLSIQRILIEIFSRAHAKGKKDLNGFKFGTFAGRFPSDDGASMAVKGLNLLAADRLQGAMKVSPTVGYILNLLD